MHKYASAVIAALIFTGVIGLLVIFQLALAFGAPWGRFAWGGQHSGVLPARFRVASACSLLVYALIALLALDRADAVDIVADTWSRIGMWIVFAYLSLGVAMNAVSRSKPERYAMTPAALVLAVLAFLIAQNGAL